MEIYIIKIKKAFYYSNAIIKSNINKSDIKFRLVSSTANYLFFFPSIMAAAMMEEEEIVGRDRHACTGLHQLINIIQSKASTHF